MTTNTVFKFSFALALAYANCNSLSFAQSRPDAGSLLPQVPKAAAPSERNANPLQVNPEAAAAPTAANGSFEVKSFVFETDATGISEDELRALLINTQGGTRTLRELQQAAARIESYLRVSKGYLQAKAWVPVQEVKDGVVLIKIVQGTVAGLQVDVGLLKPAIAQGLLTIAGRYITRGAPLTVAVLEQAAYRSMDYLGRTVRVVLVPASQFGHYDVRLEVSAARSVSGSVSLDNTGNTYTAALRDTSVVRFADVTGHADALSFSGQLLTPNQRSAKLRYQVPTIDAWAFGSEYQYTDYHLSGDFAPLNASGRSTTLSFDANRVLLHTRAFSTQVGVALLQRRVYNALAADSVNQRQIDTATFKTSAAWSGPIESAAGILLSAGRARLDRNAADAGADANTAQLAGGFVKALGNLSLTMDIGAGKRLGLELTGQAANKNLDSSEKISLGGLSGVRAYPNGEGLADQGLVMQLQVSKNLTDKIQVAAFLDHGRVNRNKRPWNAATGPNTFSLTGAGLSVTMQPANNLSLQTLVCTAIGGNPAASADAGADSSGHRGRVRAWLLGTLSY